MEVADLSQMLAQARVDETDIASVAVGQPVKVHLLAYPDEIFPGTVTSVALARSTERGANTGAAGDAKTFKVEVLLDVQNRRIPSGLTADVEIETKKNKGVLRVPTQSVLGRPTDLLPAGIRNDPNVDPSKTVAMVVFKFVNDKAVITPVTVGAADNSHTMILGGLGDGDRVITGPYKVLETLAHDQAVTEEVAVPATQPAATQAS
jgi:HlyD family secretion protein